MKKGVMFACMLTGLMALNAWAGPTLELVSPFTASGAYGVDYTLFQVSPANPTTTFASFPGDVTAQVQSVGLGLGPGDFSGFVAGRIALIGAGAGPFNLKVTNAQTAGAAGAIIYDSTVRPLVNYSLESQTSIPSVFVTNNVGTSLLGLLGSGPATVHMDTRLSPPKIFGRVYQTDRITPIGGATVQAARMPEKHVACQDVSLADGSYALYLSPGDYRLTVTAPGYAREFYNNVTASNEATIITITDASRLQIDVDLTEGGAISGHVYQSNGITPITNARVRARPSAYFFDEGFSATSAADGSYVLTGLALGQYKVTAEAPGYAKLRYYNNVYGWGNATNVAVTPPQTRSGIDIRLEPGGSISGHVYGSDGTTPVSVSIIADPTIRNFEGIGATSGADGAYRIDGLPADSYTLRIGENPPGWYAGQFYNGKDSRSAADKVPVSVGSDTPNINFVLAEGGKISGHLYDQATGRPISGVQILPELLSGEVTTPSPITSYDGSYSINLKPGTYHLTQNNPPGYIRNWYAGVYSRTTATPVSVSLRQTTSEIDMYLSRPGSISGRVYRVDGVTRIAGASLYAFPIDARLPGAGANTDASGVYTIRGLPAGTYVVSVTGTGYVSASRQAIVVGAANTPNIDFSLAAYPYTVVPIGQSVVGVSGGTTVVSDQSSDLFGASVTVPAGALTENTVITIGSVNAPAFPSELIGIGSPVHFGPEGLSFAVPVTISIPYTQQQLDAAGVTDPRLLAVYTYSMSAGAWVLVEGGRTVDTVRKLIMVQVDHFSMFRIGVRRDTTPPLIAGLPAPNLVLWPPDRKMIQVAVITATDDGWGLAAFNVAATSNEPSDPGDPDIRITGSGLGPRTVKLRADRLGTGKGRIYTITATARDLAGNTATATAAVTVPHDQSR